ncbi:MAG: phosphatase PAP2 family protein [Phycisphaerae bacterium]
MTPARMNRLAGQVASWLCWGLGVALVVWGLLGLDQVFYREVSLRLQTANPLDRDFYHVTKPVWLALRLIGGSLVGTLIMYFVVMATHARSWRTANVALVSVLCAVVVANVAQAAIGRQRPNQAGGQLAFTTPMVSLFERQGVCFPSGEAAMAFALACVLSRLYPGGRAAFYVLAVCTASARLVNGAHFLSDVVAGAMAGVLVGRGMFALLSARFGLAANSPSRGEKEQIDERTHADGRRVPGR